MKKMVSILISSFLIAFCGISHAEIAQDRIAIGGVGYGASMQYVYSIYGQPTEVQYPVVNWNGRKVQAYFVRYGNRFKLAFLRHDETAIDIQTTGTNLATPDGVKVGMPLKTVKEVYGEPDSVRNAHGGTLYGYVGELNNGECSMLEFDVRDGVIVQMEIHIRH